MADQQAEKQFTIQKVYLKDASFESPASPASFGQKPWDPHIDLNLNHISEKIGDDQYEVILKLTMTASHENETTFLIEIQQAGIFQITGFTDDELKYLLGSQCATQLFPYAREQVSDLTVRGGFPPLLLSPVNFDALYQQHLNQRQDEAES